MNSILFMFTSIFSLLMFGVSIYAFVLFIKLAHRGIRALDIYIEEKSNKNL